jgi:hypothetical protein
MGASAMHTKWAIQPPSGSNLGRIRMHSASPAVILAQKPDALPAPDSEELLRLSRNDAASALAQLDTTDLGLLNSQAEARLAAIGPNIVGHAPGNTILEELVGRANNPLNLLLMGLAGVSYFLGDVRAAIIIVVMVLLAIGTAFIQEHRCNQAAAKLRAMVKNFSSARRRSAGSAAEFVDVPLEQIVPGDIVRLSAGDVLPGDLRFLSANDLFINQAALTGESMPCEKSPECRTNTRANIFDLTNIGFMGSNVVSGYTTGVVIRTGGPHLLRHSRALDRRTARTIELRPGHQSIHLAHDPFHGGHGARRVPDQWLHERQLAGGIPVLRRGRGGPDAGNAADDRDRQSCEGRDGCPMHRQDRNTDSRPHHPQEALGFAGRGLR